MHRRVIASYLALQGAAVLAWWLALFAVPAWQAPFSPAADPFVLQAFLVPDLVFLAAGSLAAAAAVAWERWAQPAVAMVFGALGYSTLYLLAWSVRTGEGTLGVVAMTLSCAGTAVALAAVARPARR